VKLRIGRDKETDRIVPRPIPRIILGTAVLLTNVGWLSGATDAQTPSGPQQDTEPDPQPRISSLRTLRNLESASDQQNRLGRGDEITVDFVGCADLTFQLVVGPDGGIRLPLAGDRMLAGRPREQAAKDNRDAALSTYYTNLAVQVTVTKCAANKALVLGAVERPGVVTLDGAPKLLDAVSRSGLETGPNKTSRIAERRATDRGHDQAALVECPSPTITAAALFGVGLP
jgi:protein involved in polysaccharide export with SLBB domain